MSSTSCASGCGPKHMHSCNIDAYMEHTGDPGPGFATVGLQKAAQMSYSPEYLEIGADKVLKMM